MSFATRFDELKAMGDLPSPSGVALEIMRLTQREETSIQDLARVIQADPALAGRLLKFANSASVGVRRPVVAIEDVVKLLGIAAIRQFVLGISVLSNYSHGRCEGFDYPGFWSHSLATALAAQALAGLERVIAPEEAFTCGLLARVGQLGLAAIYPDSYTAVLLSCSHADEQALLAREHEKFVTNHREMTIALLEDWGLPAVHLEGIAASYQPGPGELEGASRVQRIARQLYFSGHIARFCVAQAAEQSERLANLEELAFSFELDEASLERLLKKITQAWIEWGRLLAVPTQEVPSLVNLKEELQEKMERQTSASEASNFTPLRILLVSDDELNCKRFTGWLESMGHSVNVAREGREGLSLVLENQCQLVIYEHRLSGASSMKFCRSLREMKRGQQVYLIVLTGPMSGDEAIRIFEAGADDHIAKPFNYEVLQARVGGGERLIRLREEAEQEREATRGYLADLAVANRRLGQMAMTDSLTGLPNRRYAMERMEQAWAEYERNQNPFSCLVIDLDYFKQVNDQYGHEAGDGVLREIANVFRSSARSSDIICRLGGEEFLAVCPDTASAEAFHVAERLRRAVEEHRWTSLNSTGALSISIGLATSLEEMQHWNDLYRLADQALYQAKRSGRNRVCMASSPDRKN
ncbi:diguanylate cyclase [Nitrosococcus watsonii]|uniref:diguanylate cyclase n=1 Tax=Nitrosococcus watsoni (strain C-113) TaxID=105559 RepID=D8KA65_NITWC|nr:diguanylate cyclase [Nitrosococcus watsonii]ADJ27380.1 response regulator receiver modulated diguanylate cyclase [Nitrosococcus watsonii C-113]